MKQYLPIVGSILGVLALSTTARAEAYVGTATPETINWTTLGWTPSVWANGATNTATISGLGAAFAFDQSIIAKTLTFTGGPSTGTTFTQGAETTLTGALNFSGMTGKATFNGVAVSPTLPVVFDPGDGKTLAINDAATRITGHGGMEFVSGTSTVTLNNTDNAGGRYTATGSKTILNIDTKVNDSYGSFKNNPWGVFTYRVTEGGTLVFTGVNPMGHGAPYNNDSGVGLLDNGTVRSTAAQDVVISGIQSIAKSSTATFDNASPSAGLIYNGATFDLATGATVNFTGTSLRFRPERMNYGGQYVKIRLAEGSTVNATAPTIIDYCIGGHKGLWITGPGAVNFSSISDGWINIEKEVGDTAAPTFSATGLVNSHVIFCDGTTFDLSKLEGPLTLSNVNATAATDTLNLELGTRKVSAGTQLVTWTGTFDTKPIVQIVRKGVPDVDTNVVVKGNSIDVSSSILDAASVDRWTALNADAVSGDVILANVGNAFDFNTELSVTSLTLRGGNETTLTNTAPVTASDLWDLSAMTGNVSFGVTPVTTKIFRIGAAGVSPPLNILGTTDPDTPLYLKAKIEGDAGLNFTGHSKLELSGYQNAGGHYTVTGADTSLTIHNTDNPTGEGGNFSANTWKVLTFDVLSNATLTFSGANPMGIGYVHGDESIIATIDNGTVKSTGGGHDTCILGGYTVRGTSYFTNENTSAGLIWHSSTFNITPGAMMIANGAADSVAGRSIRVRTHWANKRNLFALADDATLDLQLPLIIDGDARASHGMQVIGSGLLKTTTIAGGRLTLATKDGAMLNGVLTDFTCADTGPTLFVADTMHATNLHIVGKASLDISQRAMPLSMGMLSASTDVDSTLTLDVGSRVLNVGDQILAWSGVDGAQLTRLTVTLSSGLPTIMLSTGLYVAERPPVDASNTEVWSGLNITVDATTNASITNLGLRFDFDETISASSLSFTGTNDTAFTNVGNKILTVDEWNFSGMTGAITFAPPSITTNVFHTGSTSFSLIGSDNPEQPQVISARVLGTGNIIAQSGASQINFVSNQNAGGTYVVKKGATLTLKSPVNESAGIFNANPNGRLMYTVEGGATLALTGDNLMGWGNYGMGNYTSTIAGKVLRNEVGDVCITGWNDIHDGAVFENNTTGGMIFIGCTLKVVDNAKLTLRGQHFRFRKETRTWVGNYIYAKFDLGTNATMEVTAPGTIDGEDACWMDVVGNPTSKLILKSLTNGKVVAQLSLGGPALTVKGNVVTDDKGITTLTTMNTVVLNLLSNSTINFTDVALPLLTVKKVVAGAPYTLTLDVTGRRFSAATDEQLMAWDSKEANVTIAFTGSPEGVTLEERETGVFVTVASSYVADASANVAAGEAVATGLADEANLAWTPPWKDGADNHAAIRNLGAAFALDTAFTAKTLAFYGDHVTTFTQPVGSVITVSDMWNFANMAKGAIVDIPSITTTAFQIGGHQPITLVGSTDSATPQTITTTMKGTGGVIIKGSDDPLVKRYTKLDLRGTDNEGGHYTVKAGATLFLGTDHNGDYGSFRTNPNGILTYTVEAGATLDLYSANPTGWGTAYTTMPYSGEVAGLVRSSNAHDNCISGTFTIRDGAEFKNTSTNIGKRGGTGLLFVGTVLNIDNYATVKFTGTQFRCRRESDLLRTVFNLGTGATMNVEVPTYLDGLSGLPRNFTVTGKAGSQLILTSIEGALEWDGSKITDTSLILDGPSLNATGDLSQIHLDLRQDTTILLTGRTEALALKGIRIPEAPLTLTIDMAGYSVPDGDAAPVILSWNDPKPINLAVKVVNYNDKKYSVSVDENQVTLTPIHSITITGGDVTPNVMAYLRGRINQNVSISATDATKAYAFTLDPSVDGIVATLNCSFKVAGFVLNAGNTQADITIEVTGATAPVLNTNYEIGIYASVDGVASEYKLVDGATGTTLLPSLTPSGDGTAASRATILNVPLQGKTFFKARLIEK